MPAKYVRPYSKGQKNDFNDAEAIAEAVQRPTMKFVATKTAEHLGWVGSARIKRAWHLSCAFCQRLVQDRLAWEPCRSSTLLGSRLLTVTSVQQTIKNYSLSWRPPLENVKSELIRDENKNELPIPVQEKRVWRQNSTD